jgi:hypothetical protein
VVTVRRIGVAQRRARLGARHHLAVPAGTITEAAENLVALHGTDPASVFLALAARTDAEAPDVERAMYDDRSLVRMLGMRRTMYAVPREVVPVVQASSANAIAMRERRRLVTQLTEAGVVDGEVEPWLEDVEESTARALAHRGEATASELAEDEPRLRTSMLMAAGKPYESRQNISTRVLFLLAAEGRIVRGRPRGSWTSSQYRWSPMDEWLPGGVVDLPLETAQRELVRRWLRTYGPGTAADLKWWTGWTASQVKKALAQLDTVAADLDGTTGIVLADDEGPAPEVAPWAALLPALDPTAMGWSERAWYVGEHGPALFDRSGNIGPTIWWNGRIVGGWAQNTSGDVVHRLLDDIGAEGTAAVSRAASRTQEWLGEVQVTPRFRTPLERELGA